MIWDEAENRRHVQKAMLTFLLEGGSPDVGLRAPDRARGRDPAWSPASPTKTARQARIIELLETHEVRSQSELAELLAADGLHVTQGTLSRDLVEIGAVRVRSSGGQLVYAVPGEGGDRTPHVREVATFEARLARLCDEVLVSAEGRPTWSSCDPAGAAQYLASAVDHASRPTILGTIAGDDTVLLITRTRWRGGDRPSAP